MSAVKKVLPILFSAFFLNVSFTPDKSLYISVAVHITPQSGKNSSEKTVEAAFKPVIEYTQEIRPAETQVEKIKPVISKPAVRKDVVIYRIQFLSSVKPQGIKHIIVNGISYNTYEYFYLNEYRYTIGVFSTLQPARELKIAARRSGYTQAFVVAFKNNIRSLDKDLFK